MKDEFNSLCLLYRMTLLFFALSGLDVLGCAEALQDYRKDAIEWIYAQQILPDSDDPGNSITICRYCMGREGSPDLMPLEEVFNQVKSIMKQNCTLFQACSAPRVFLLMAFSFVSVENCIGYIHHSGYIQ